MIRLLCRLKDLVIKCCQGQLDELSLSLSLSHMLIFLLPFHQIPLCPSSWQHLASPSHNNLHIRTFHASHIIYSNMLLLMSLFLLGRSSVSFLPIMSKKQAHPQQPHNILDVIQNIPCHKDGYFDLFSPQSHGASSFSFHFVQGRMDYHQTLNVFCDDHVMLRGVDWSLESKVFFFPSS